MGKSLISEAHRHLELSFVGGRIEMAHVTEQLRPSRRVLVTADEREVATFFAPLDRWSELEYEKQWNDVIKRVRSGATRDCFVIGAYAPQVGCLVNCLGLWVRPDVIKLNELAVPEEDLPSHEQQVLVDDPAQAFRWMPEYSEWCSDTQTAIHHWTVSLDSVLDGTSERDG